MRKLVMTFLAFAATTFCAAQSEPGFYSPDGTLLADANNSIRSVVDAQFPGIPFISDLSTFTDDDSTSVVYKLFTNEPLFIVTEHPENIPEYVSAFDLDEFLHSWKLTYELDNRIGELTDTYILTTLGGPNDRIRSSNGDTSLEQWYYEDLGVTLFFRDSILDSYVEH